MIEISKIEEILPQTQCRQCGYHDCADYAKAIAVGEKHNRCPAEDLRSFPACLFS